MNKFKKKSKTKGFALGIAILSSAAVVSTGFAAWVIGGGETKDVSGTITADTVSSSVHTILNLKWEEATDESAGSGKICFGHPEKMEEPSPWLTNDDSNGTFKEKLTAKLTFDIDNVETDKELADVLDTGKCNFAETTDSAKYTSAALTFKYVGELPTIKEANVAVDDKVPGVYFVAGTLSNKVLPVTMTVVFTWGSHFAITENDSSTITNPYNFYNKQTKTSALENDANTALKAIQGLNDATFKVTIATK